MLVARRRSWVLVLVVGLVLDEAVRRGVVDTGNPDLVPALILLGAAVVPAAFVTLIQSQGDLAAVQQVLFARGVLSPAAHMAWTGLTAAALWQAAVRSLRPRALAGFAGVLLVAVLLHTAWDSAPTFTVDVVVAVVSLLRLGWTTHRLAAPHRREHPPAPLVPPVGAYR